jgi:hypothetical protein
MLVADKGGKMCSDASEFAFPNLLSRCSPHTPIFMPQKRGNRISKRLNATFPHCPQAKEHRTTLLGT